MPRLQFAAKINIGVHSKVNPGGSRVDTAVRRDAWESERGYPLLVAPLLAHDNEEWRISADQKRFVLLDPGSEPLPRAN